MISLMRLNNEKFDLCIMKNLHNVPTADQTNKKTKKANRTYDVEKVTPGPVYST